MSLQRLRTDFHFAIITLFGVMAAVCITPFAIFRFVDGQLVAGAVDVAIVLSICAVVAYVWRGGDLEHAGLVVVIVTTIGSLTAVTLLGSVAVFWIYPALVANFLLVNRIKALLISALAVAFLTLHGGAFVSGQHTVVFLMSALLVSVFAFIFSHRTEMQRRQLEALAAHDPLTGAYNRRAMEHELQIAIETHRRTRISVGLAVLDLDHFKRINDEHGHEAGDRVLVDFASLVMRTMRRGDRFFRIGGEEFVLLLPGADTTALRRLTELLRRKVAKQLQYRGEPVSVSIGAASLTNDEDMGAWLARADAAMYRAKHQGRDRAVIDEGEGLAAEIAPDVEQG